jgi:hypothetical protein
VQSLPAALTTVLIGRLDGAHRQVINERRPRRFLQRKRLRNLRHFGRRRKAFASDTARSMAVFLRKLFETMLATAKPRRQPVPRAGRVRSRSRKACATNCSLQSGHVGSWRKSSDRNVPVEPQPAEPLGQKILGVAQRQRVSDIHHHDVTSGELLKYRNGLVLATSLARPGTPPKFL